MKYIKHYEDINKPQVGDYVEIYARYFDNRLKDFFKTEIGQIIKIDNKDYPYLVEFEKEKPIIHEDAVTIIYDDEDEYKMRVEESEIKYFSSSKEELEIIISANKYNL